MDWGAASACGRNNIQGPQIDFTPGPDCYARFLDWKDECTLMLDGPLASKSNTVKANYVQIWAGRSGRVHLKSLNLMAAEKADHKIILQKLKEWVEPRWNAIE